MQLHPWRWLKRLTAPTLFRVLPIDPAQQRDELLSVIRGKLYGHAYRAEYLTKAEAAELLDLIDHFQSSQAPRLHPRPVQLSTRLEYGRPVDTTNPPL